MIEPPQPADTISDNSLPVSQRDEREATMIVKRADRRLPEHQPLDHKLRLRLIAANVAAWFLIVVAIRLILF